MNIFVVPSWYPSSTNNLSGIFTKEQIEALSLNNDLNLLVSTWGHLDGFIRLSQPASWLDAICWRLKQVNKTKISNFSNYNEFFFPSLSWTHKIPFGGARQLIKANKRNFLQAQSSFGKIDLIHAHVSYPAGFLAYLLSKEFSIPYVITEHMGPFPFPNLIKNNKLIKELTLALTNSSANIAVSEHLANQIKAFGHSCNYVIPNMVNEDVFKIQKKDTSKKVKFLFLSSLTKEKGIEDFIDAISLWNPSSEDFEFLIAGDGPLQKKLKRKSQDNNLDCLKWLGKIQRSKVPDLINNSDIFVLPSRHESFGVVIAEAIACGKPVITTKCGGPQDIINNNNGILIDVGDIEALSLAMQKISENLSIYNPDLIRKDFVERFSRPAVMNKLIKVYEEVLIK